MPLPETPLECRPGHFISPGGLSGSTLPTYGRRNHPAGFPRVVPTLHKPDKYVTILSGTSGSGNYHVVTGSGTNATAVLNGFEITGGNAKGSGFFEPNRWRDA